MASPSASRKLTATASRQRDCAPPSSIPASITAHCAPAWPSSRHARPIPSYPSPNPSELPKPPSIVGTNRKNSQHKNLTQLHHIANRKNSQHKNLTQLHHIANRKNSQHKNLTQLHQ